MTRTTRAFLVAPFWAPALAGLQMALFGLPRNLSGMSPTEWVLLTLLLSLLAGCLSAWTLGLVIHRLLVARRITALWRHLAIWFLAGLVLRMLLVVAAWVPGGGLDLGLEELYGAVFQRPLFLLSGGFIAALMGATIRFLSGSGSPDTSPAK